MLHLAREYSDDIGCYVEGKSEFLLTILREMGFTTDRLSDVERMNRRPSGEHADAHIPDSILTSSR